MVAYIFSLKPFMFIKNNLYNNFILAINQLEEDHWSSTYAHKLFT